jgi:hypothetical protein
MKLTGLHLLLTYTCNYECDHCFVWSGPSQPGTMRLEQIEQILDQASDLGTIEWIYFEGGEPFLYYAILLAGVRAAAARGFKVGIVSNAYWAADVRDAVEWLRPFAGLVQDLSVSSDLYHGGPESSPDQSPHAVNARAAAAELGLPVGVISVAPPEASGAAAPTGTLPPGDSAVMFRGRAAVTLTTRAEGICVSRGVCTSIPSGTSTSARASRWATSSRHRSPISAPRTTPTGTR